MIFQPFLQLLDEGLTAHKAACPIFGQHKMLQRASLVAQMVKKLPAMQETYVWSLGLEDPLEKGMTPHSSILGERRILGEFHGQRSLGDCRTWGCKESDTTNTFPAKCWKVSYCSPECLPLTFIKISPYLLVNDSLSTKIRTSVFLPQSSSSPGWSSPVPSWFYLLLCPWDDDSTWHIVSSQHLFVSWVKEWLECPNITVLLWFQFQNLERKASVHTLRLVGDQWELLQWWNICFSPLLASQKCQISLCQGNF